MVPEPRVATQTPLSKTDFLTVYALTLSPERALAMLRIIKP
jgi:hypothetical protein